jgi:hypothetical protein
MYTESQEENFDCENTQAINLYQQKAPYSHGFNYEYIKETDRNKYAVEFKKRMGKDVKTHLRGYHASGLVNNIPIFRDAAVLLALADLEQIQYVPSKHHYLTLSMAQNPKRPHILPLKPQISRNMRPKTWNLALHNLIPNLACPAIINLLLSVPLHTHFLIIHPSSRSSESQYKA